MDVMGSVSWCESVNRHNIVQLQSILIKTSINAFALSLGIAFAADENALKLWYREPAGKWTQALPVGNGRLAAMVFGDVRREHLQLNEDTVWSGEKRDR